ncbi:MAG: CRTAC1 family protein [Aureliella sp.]
MSEFSGFDSSGDPTPSSRNSRRPKTVAWMVAAAVALVPVYFWIVADGPAKLPERARGARPAAAASTGQPTSGVSQVLPIKADRDRDDRNDASAPAAPFGAKRVSSAAPGKLNYKMRGPIDESAYRTLMDHVRPWPPRATSGEIAERFQGLARQTVAEIDQYLAQSGIPPEMRSSALFARAGMLNYDGDPDQAYETLSRCRQLIEGIPHLAEEHLYAVIFLQGVSALRKGENENCILCRGESSCILPISPKAVHVNPAGSRLAIHHFTECLQEFPDDFEAEWLLNLAHMTLGEYPAQVDPAHLISLDHFTNDATHAVGKFRDVGHLVGLDRFNQAGGGIMEDFDNDGLLDVVVSTSDPTGVMGFYRNTGKGRFEDLTAASGLGQQYGGLYCVQTDYDNDGDMDVFVPRGAWLAARQAMRPSLLRNNGDRTFTDVTVDAGLDEPLNSITGQWADYDNDGWLDLIVCCEKQPNRLYHNLQNGTFRDVAAAAGVNGISGLSCKGAAWGDYDNDGYQDLFLTYQARHPAQLYHNNRDGTFRRATKDEGITGPLFGFACWSWDYDNDGWLDIFATSFDRTLGDIVLGLIGRQTQLNTSRLFRNLHGQGFQDVTASVGLNHSYSTMGCNFGDVDNDGYLDMYLGTGDPNISTLVPNRLLRNLGGRRFAEITSSSGTGVLQKGHGVAFGDWDRDGNNDIFIQMGGAIDGDKYHNILFQNPGHANAWICLKLIGEKSNRAAIGARIKLVTAGPRPLTVCRAISSGSSFGANPLEQTIGLGEAEAIKELEIRWPTSGIIQRFTDVPLRTRLEIRETAADFREVNTPASPPAS